MIWQKILMFHNTSLFNEKCGFFDQLLYDLNDLPLAKRTNSEEKCSSGSELLKYCFFSCFKPENWIDNEYKVTSLSCLGITNQVIIRTDYLHYVKKYNRSKKRHKNTSVNMSPCRVYVRISDLRVHFRKGVFLISSYRNLLVTTNYFTLQPS